MSDLLPPNATPQEHALDDATARIGAVPTPIRELWNPDTCPADLLPWLAWGWHVTDLEGWRLADTPAKRRQLLARAIALHRKKGTPWAVKEALHAAGFGAQSRLTEGRAMRRYDGTIFADGSEMYGGHSWAEYQIEVDLGDTAGLDAATPALVSALAREWAPISRHLTRLAWRADVADTAASSEAQTTVAAWSGESLRPWRRYYDGSLRYDQGVLLTYDGGTQADGSRRYQGWAANDAHWRAGAPESDTTLALVWGGADRQQRHALYDGATQADGHTDYGHSAPVAEDAVMPITVRRHVRYDGRHRYSTRRYDGTVTATGAHRYASGIAAAGDVITYLEAA